MSSIDLFEAHLPETLLDLMVVKAGSASWPIADIPAVIEACRTANLVSLGGDLQVHIDAKVWESTNLGVAVFADEIPAMGQQGRSEAAANIAGSKFASVSTAEIEREVRTGLSLPSKLPLPQIRFSWLVASA